MSSQSFSQASGPTSQDPSDLLKNCLTTQNFIPLLAWRQLDYLGLDDDKTNDLPGSGTAIPSRGRSDDLCYGTGTMYLGGMSSMLFAFSPSFCDSFSRPTGLDHISHYRTILLFLHGPHVLTAIGLALCGAWGIREGASRPLAVSNMRVRINSILNSVTRRGTFLGNSAGVLALGYNGINSTIDAVRGKHDAFGSMAAGALTGALFKSAGEHFSYLRLVHVP